MSRAKLRLCLSALFVFTLVIGVMGASASPAFASALYLRQFGSVGGGNGQFHGPWGVAVDSAGNVYVADVGNARVEKFSGIGTFMGAWPIYNPSGSPWEVAVDHLGNVWVADLWNNYVEEFTSAGVEIQEWDGSASGSQYALNGPAGMAFDPSGNIYVVSSNDGYVKEYTSAGAFIRQWDGTSSGQAFTYGGIWGIATDSSGNVYTFDNGLSRVAEFTGTGGYIRQWGSAGTGNGQFNNAWDIAVDSHNMVYVADSANCRVQEFTPTGAYVGQWGSQGSGNGQFTPSVEGWGPGGLFVSSSGNAYVSDYGGNRIEEFMVGPAVNTPASSDWSLALLAIVGLGVAALVTRQVRAEDSI